MANTRISDLTASASNLASTDLAPVVQTVGVGPVKMTGSQLAGGLLGSTTFNGATSAGTALSTVAITGTGGQFSCAAATLVVGQNVTISGTLGGTGSITGYSSPTTYTISSTNGSTTFTLVNASTGAALTTTAGTPTGLTYVVTSPVVNFTQTWNNSNVTFTGLKFNATDTLSASGSLLLDVGTGGGTYASKFKVDKNGAVTQTYNNSDFTINNAALLIDNTNASGQTGINLRINGTVRGRWRADATGNLNWIANGGSHYFIVGGEYGTGTVCSVFASSGIKIPSTRTLGFTNDAAGDNAVDTILTRDGAPNTLALRNGTSAQTFRVYNTYTDGSNYERGSFGFTSSNLYIVTEAGGTGVVGNIILQTNASGKKINFAAGGSITWFFNGFDFSAQSNSSRIVFGASQDAAINYVGAGKISVTGTTPMVALGGSTSSYPALKQSSATLAVRLADDSANAALTCGTTGAAGTALNVTGTGDASIMSVTNTTTGTLFSVVNSSSSTIFSVNDAAATGVQVAGISFGLTGNISAAAWTTSGIRYRNVAATLTDTSSSGTVATAYTDVFGGNTIAASSSTTYTNYATFRLAGPTAGTNVTFTNSWALSLGGSLVMDDATNIAVGTTTGTKIGTATSQKIGFWNAAPIAQPTTGVAAATVAATGTGDVVAASTTFDGYTIPQIVKAMRNAGLLA